eukprot:gene9238-1324_t
MTKLIDGEIEMKRIQQDDDILNAMFRRGWKKKTATLKEDGFYTGYIGIDIKKIFSKKDIVTVEELRKTDSYESFRIKLLNKEIIEIRSKDKQIRDKWFKVFQEWIKVKVKTKRNWGSSVNLTFDVGSQTKVEERRNSQQISELEEIKNNKTIEYWLMTGENNNIDECLFGNATDIEKLKNLAVETSDNVTEFKKFRYETEDISDLVWLLFENSLGDYGEMLQEELYFSCNVICVESDENLYLALTFNSIIFFDEDFQVKDIVSISEIYNILQDYFKQKLCLISTTQKKFLISFENSYFKLMFFDYFSSAFYTLHGLTPEISVVRDIKKYIKEEVAEEDTLDAQMCLFLTDKYDFGYLKDQRELFDLIYDCGETEVIFTEKVINYNDNSKDEKVLFVLTSESVYLLNESFFQFASLEYLEKIAYHLDDDKFQVFFDTPTDFDINIVMPRETGELMLELVKNLLLGSIAISNTLNEPVGEKPVAFFKQYVMEGLESSIKGKYLKGILLCLRYSKMLHSTTEKEKKLIKEGVKLFKELKDNQLIKNKYKEALKEEDIFVLYQLSKEYPMGDDLKPIFYKLMNQNLIKMKIREFIEEFDFKQTSYEKLINCFEKGKNWGLSKDMEELEIELLKKIQLHDCLDVMKNCSISTEIYSLTMAVLQGTNLGSSTKEENDLIENTKERLSALHQELKIRVDIQNIKTFDALDQYEKNFSQENTSKEAKERLKEDFEIAKRRIKREEMKRNWESLVHKEIKSIRNILRDPENFIEISILDKLNKLLNDKNEFIFEDSSSVELINHQVEKRIHYQCRTKFEILKPKIEAIFDSLNENEIKKVIQENEDFPLDEMKNLLKRGKFILYNRKTKRELRLLIGIVFKMTFEQKLNSIKFLDNLIQGIKNFKSFSKVLRKLGHELVKLKEVKELEINLDESMLSLSSSLIIYSIEQATHEPVLQNKIKLANLLIESEQERKKFVLSKVDQFLLENNRSRLFQIIQFKNYIPEEKMNEIQEKLKSEIFKKERDDEIKELMSKNKLNKLESYLQQNEHFLPEENLKIIKQKIKKMKEYESYLLAIQLSLNSAINEGDLKQLEATLRETDKIEISDLATVKLIRESKILFKKLQPAPEHDFLPFPPTPRIQPQTHASSNSSTPGTSSRASKKVIKMHPYLLELYDTIQVLIQNMNDLKMIAGKWHVPSLYQKGRNIVKAIFVVLSHQTKIGLFSRKSVWNIFSENKNQIIQKYLKFFLSLEVTKNIENNKKEQILALMFIHYLLHKNVLIEVLESIFNDSNYLSSCYEQQSIMRNSKLSDDLFSILALLYQFNFEFEPKNESENTVLIAHPLTRLKMTIKQLIEMFIVSKKEDIILKRMDIINFIRGQLHSEIYSILIFGFNSGNLIAGKNYLWDLIEQASTLKLESAMDFGGIYLPHCVNKINKIAKKKSNEHIKETKFRIFIFQALIDKALSDYIESIFHLNPFVRDRYPKKSIVFENLNLSKMCKMLGLLSKLEFPFKTENLILDGLI